MRSDVVGTVLAAAMVVASCGGDTASPGDIADGEPFDAVAENPSPTPEPSGVGATGDVEIAEDDADEVDVDAETPAIEVSGVSVETDLAYYEAPNGDVLLLDVYHPDGGQGLPLVVVFHSNPVFGRSKESVAGLATIVAERGAVVVAPAYGANLSVNDMGFLADEVERWYREEGPCAVWAAVDLAASFGADPAKLVVVGDVTGTLPANAATFSPAADIAGCAAPRADASIATTIFFESDWLMVPGIWDSVLTDDPDYINRIVPWDHLSTPTSTRIRILAGENVASNTVRSLQGASYLQSDWIRLRDPEGVWADAFAASGTLDDGELSFADVMQVVTGLLVDAGWDADFAFVPGVGHALDTTASKQLVADLVFDGLSS